MDQTDARGAGHGPPLIEFDTPELVEALDVSTQKRDLPGMADVDASLLLFCREIKRRDRRHIR